MLSSTLTLADAAAANKTFNLLPQQGDAVIRVDTTSTPTVRRIMSVRHQDIGKPNARSSQHNVTFQKSYVDANGVTQTTSAGITLRVSHDSTAAAYIADLVAFLTNFMAGSGNLAAIELGES